MLRIKQRYLSIRVSAQTDDVIGRADKEDKSNTDKDDVEDFSMLMNESSMEG